MATIVLNAVGLRCPQPVLKLTAQLPQIPKGTVLEMKADCPEFEADITKWTTRMKKTLLAVTEENGVKTATIQF